MIKVLIVGAGGREHALLERVSKSSIEHELYVFGESLNLAMQKLCKNFVVISGGSRELAEHIIKLSPDLCIIGPEKYLASAVVNIVQNQSDRIKFIGFPSGAAKIETDKAWCRRQLEMISLQSLSPKFKFFTAEEDSDIVTFLETLPNGFAVKPNGLTGGKGVRIFSENEFRDGLRYAEELFDKRGQVLIEERLVGQEFSLMSLTDGIDCAHFPPVRDFKRAFENDEGPNTGGMGAVCFDGMVPKAFLEQAQYVNETVSKHLKSLQQFLRSDFSGILFGGYMITADNKLKLIEFNSRFGDPEIIAALQSINPKVDLLKTFMIASTRWLGVKNIQDVFQFYQPSRVYYACPKDYPEKKITTIEIDSRIFDHTNVYCGGVEQRLGGKCFTTGSRTFAFSDLKVTKMLPQMFEFLRWREDIHIPQMDAYKLAGVNIETANEAVASIQSLVSATHTEHTINIPNGFGGLTYIPQQVHEEQAILVTSVDSVGSKTEMALALSNTAEEFDLNLKQLGVDIVNHCINDILVMGCTRPLNFVDYFACNTLNPTRLRMVVDGMSQACKSTGCTIAGGETAEIRDTYKSGAIDVAGTINGVMTRSEILHPRKTITAGDLVFALSSVSAHTNGFTLINKIRRRLSPLSEEDKKWLTQLTLPHRCYLQEIKKIYPLRRVVVKGLVHVTGGGLIDNPPRILADDKQLVFNLDTLMAKMPDMFRRLWKEAGIAPDNYLQMFHTFNCGIGMLIVVPATDANRLKEILPEVFQVGEIHKRTARESAVIFE